MPDDAIVQQVLDGLTRQALLPPPLLQRRARVADDVIVEHVLDGFYSSEIVKGL